MAEKYTFSVEDSLVDIIGFCKKIVITFWHTVIFPLEIVKNSDDILNYEKQQRQKDEGKENIAFDFSVRQQNGLIEGIKGEITLEQKNRTPFSSDVSGSSGSVKSEGIQAKSRFKKFLKEIWALFKPDHTNVVNPSNKYVNYFLYFIFASLLFLSYYKAFNFNRENNIQEPFLETLISTNSYLADTSIIDKLRANFIFILLALCMVSATSAVASVITVKAIINVKKGGERLAIKNCFFQYQRISYYIAGATLLLQLIPMFVRVIGSTTTLEDTLGRFFLYGYWIWSLRALVFYCLNKLKKGKSDLKGRKKLNFKCKSCWLVFCLCLTIVGPFIIERWLFRDFFDETLSEKGDMKFTPKVSIHSFDDSGEVFKLTKQALNDSLYILGSNIYLTNEWKEILINANKSLSFEIINTPPNQPSHTVHINFRIELQDSSLKTPGGNWVVPYKATKEIAIISEPQSKQVIDRIQEFLSNRKSSKTRYIISYFPENTKEKIAYNYIYVQIQE